MTTHLIALGCATPSKTDPILTVCCTAVVFDLPYEEKLTFDPTKVGPVCGECGHPLWAKTSVECGVCSACRPFPAIKYVGEPYLQEHKVMADGKILLMGGPRVPCRNGE